MDPEYQYIDDEDMVPTKELMGKRPKWATPKEGSLQALILDACGGRKHYKNRQEQEEVNGIAKRAAAGVSLTRAEYPREWVDHCLEVCRQKWHEGKPMNLASLIKYIKNVDRKAEWIAAQSRHSTRDMTDPDKVW